MRGIKVCYLLLLNRKLKTRGNAREQTSTGKFFNLFLDLLLINIVLPHLSRSVINKNRWNLTSQKMAKVATLLFLAWAITVSFHINLVYLHFCTYYFLFVSIFQFCLVGAPKPNYKVAKLVSSSKKSRAKPLKFKTGAITLANGGKHKIMIIYEGRSNTNVVVIQQVRRQRNYVVKCCGTKRCRGSRINPVDRSNPGKVYINISIMEYKVLVKTYNFVFKVSIKKI